jgi:hypothetical protein
MVLKFLVKSGPQTGEQFEIKPETVIGRAGTDISINDPKISGRHAKIENDGVLGWVLKDLGSTNGLKIDGKRVAQVELRVGTVIRIGNTDFEVITTPDPLFSSPPPPPFENAPQPKGPAWAQYFADFSQRSFEKVIDRPNPLKPFDPLLVLSIIRGPQIGSEWELGYGPRSVGTDSIDLPLFDSQAPGIAFTVTPKGPFAFFETPFPKKVRINNKSLSSETLRGDDLIAVGDTVIKVSYRE